MSDSESSEEPSPIVIDNGTSTFRAGFAGEDAPQWVFSNVVGREKFQTDSSREFYVGDEAQKKREILSLNYPIEHGIITNWEDMEKIWDYAFFHEMRIDPEENPILMNEPPLNPKANREKLAQVMFEKYGTQAFFVAFQPMLHLLASGLHHGLMVNVGEGTTHVVPIYETQVVFQSIRRFDFGGRDLTKYLQHLLYQRDLSFTSSSELEEVREMKEEFCFVSEDGDLNESSQQMGLDKSFRLSDGSSIRLSHERYKVPELLFKPDGIFHRGPSLQEMIVDSLNDSAIDARKEMYFLISLSGGTTLMLDFGKRLKKEVVALSGQREQSVKVWERPERKYYNWIGGSILAFLSTFQSAWVTKEEYDEYGPHVVNIRCYGE